MFCQIIAEVAQETGTYGAGAAGALCAVAVIAVTAVGKMGMAALKNRGRAASEPGDSVVAMFDKGRCDSHGRKLEQQGRDVARHDTDIAVLKVSTEQIGKKVDETAKDVKELLRRVPESRG